jgi:hypothetical protein
VRFPKPLRDALFAKSAETGAPISEIVRRAVAAKLAEQLIDLGAEDLMDMLDRMPERTDAKRR